MHYMAYICSSTFDLRMGKLAQLKSALLVYLKLNKRNLIEN